MPQNQAGHPRLSRGHPRLASPERSRRLRELRLHSKGVQVAFEFVQSIHLDDVHSQSFRDFYIQRAVIDEAALLGHLLRDLESELVDFGLWLPIAYEARADEHPEDRPHSKFLDAI